MARLLKNRYEVLGILGKGGMGSVYKVRDRLRGGRIFAAKELRASCADPEKAEEALAQFQTEARILARLTHPNLPKVYDYFSLPGKQCIIMEYIEGRTLEQIIAKRGGRPFDERLVLSWVLQITRAMHFLSVQKPRAIVFRDLKPSNIMIARDGRVKLIDFGIARFFKEDKTEDTYVYGTPGYAAPEQYGTGQTDARSDIFSLGATMHHCLTGRNPSENPLDFADVRQLNPKISKGTAAIVLRALEQDREKRFQSAQEMKQAIQAVLLASVAKVKGIGRIIHARPGKAIKLPWWRRTCWVSVPTPALGCSNTTGTLSADERWLQPRPKVFGPDASELLFRVESGRLMPGREYRPHITVRTTDGIMQPELVFRKSWPWIILEAAVLVAVIAAGVWMR
jgi:serine/threonine protein kinase